jgi:hypothetical protein
MFDQLTHVHEGIIVVFFRVNTIYRSPMKANSSDLSDAVHLFASYGLVLLSRIKKKLALLIRRLAKSLPGR